MTDTGELDPSHKRLRRIVEKVAHLCSSLNHAKANHGDMFAGWTVRIIDVNHDGPMERTISVFDGYLRISKSHHDAEWVLTDVDGNTVLVLSCKHLERIVPMGKRRHSYRIVTEGETLVLAA